ncbi:MAG TPA: hypothetical protein VD913_06565, partial [bacterium]|nr:hypothetical protein [bacterium]
MSLPEVRKLKRGLSDISPIFGDCAETSKPSIECPEPLLEILCVTNADATGDSFFLNSFLASQVASAEKPCSIFSLYGTHGQGKSVYNESFSPYLRRFSIAWEQFEEICRWPIHREFLQLPFAQVLFFDFESFHSLQIEKAVSLIDKWVFLMKPNYESMIETYKLIKAASHFNREGTHYILFEGMPDDRKGENYFEKFSSIVAKHLGIQVFWLGYLDPACRSEE